MLNDFLEHLINKVYQNCRVIGWLFPPLPAASSYIKFGGEKQIISDYFVLR